VKTTAACVPASVMQFVFHVWHFQTINDLKNTKNIWLSEVCCSGADSCFWTAKYISESADLLLQKRQFLL